MAAPKLTETEVSALVAQYRASATEGVRALALEVERARTQAAIYETLLITTRNRIAAGIPESGGEIQKLMLALFDVILSEAAKHG